MAKLIYITNASVDGYIEDEHGTFDWVDPAPVHACITELVRSVATHLYGRRLYETMSYWDAPVESYPSEYRAFARIWQNAEKIVFSRTMIAAPKSKIHIERDFDPERIRKLKRESKHDIIIGGAELAGQAFEAGLVDECHLFVNPVVVGGGKRAFPAGLRQRFELLGTRRFDTGVAHLHYRVQ